MASKIIYLNGFGLMEVPAELSGQELAEYATNQARKQIAESTALRPEAKEEKPSVPILSQVGAGIAGVPAGLVSSLIGGTMQGIGGLLAPVGGRPIEEAGTAVREGIDKYLADLVGKEAAESTGAQVGKTVGNIASFFTPGAILKAAGAVGKGSAALRALAASNALRTGSAAAMSGLQGAGEQIERIRQQEAEGKQVSDLERAALAGVAGLSSAALEYAPELIFKGAAFLPRVAGKLGEAAPAAKSIEAENLAKAFGMSPAEIASRFGRGFISEAPVEMAQEGAQNLIEKYYNPERTLGEGVIEAGLIGGVAGGALEGGVDLWKGISLRRKIAKGQDIGSRQFGEAPAIPTEVQDTTLFIRDLNNQMETALQEGNTEKASRLKAQKDALESEVNRLSTNLLPAPEPPLAPIEYPGANEEINRLRELQEQTNTEVAAKYKASRFPEIPADIPNPMVTPMTEWDESQKSSFFDYVNNLPAKQAETFDSLTEGEAPIFIGELASARDASLARKEEAARLQDQAAKEQKQKEDLALVNKRIDDAKSIAKVMGYPVPAKLPIQDRAALAGLIQEQDRINLEKLTLTNEETRQRFEKFMSDRQTALQNIDQNFGVASDLARSEFNKELGKLTDKEKIDLSLLVDTKLSENKDRLDRATGEAQAQTELNKEFQRQAESDDKKAYRLAQEKFQKPYEKLSVKEQGVIWDSIRSGEGVKVSPQEVLEREEFSKKPHTTEEYREAQSALKEAGDQPITVDYLMEKLGKPTPTTGAIIGGNKALAERVARATEAVGRKQKPVESTMSKAKAKSIIEHMVERGDLVPVEGSLLYDDKATGPMYELEESALSEPKAQEATPLNVTQDNPPQQKEFNEEYARQLAPDVYAHLKSRNAGDLFITGLVNQIKTEQGAAPGSYLNRVIRLAMMNNDGGRISRDNMLATMDHEIIHGMRKLGLFTDREWRMLTTRFNASILNEKDKKRYEEIYRNQGLTPAQVADRLNEEAIAKAVKSIKDVDPKRLDPSSLSMLNKVNFYLDFGRVSSALGYNSAEDVLAAVKSGDIGKRKYAPAFERTAKGVEATGARKKIVPRTAQTEKPKAVSGQITEAPGEIAPKEKPEEAKGKPARKKATKKANVIPGVFNFTTAKGSTYVFADGKTERTKSLHQFHDPKDVGKKPVSGLTVFLSPTDARKIGFWQASNAAGKKIEIEGNKVIASSVNPLTGARGIDEKLNIASRVPKVGLSPLELWGQGKDGSWRTTHPGNAITKISAAKKESPAVEGVPVSKKEAESFDISETGEEPKVPPVKEGESFLQSEGEESDFFSTPRPNKTFLGELLEMFSSKDRKFSVFRQKLVDRYDPVRVTMIEAHKKLMDQYSKTGDESLLDQANRILSAAEGSYHSLLFSDKSADTAMAVLKNGGASIEQGIILAVKNEEASPLMIFEKLHEEGRLQDFFNFAYAKRYKHIKDDLGRDPGGDVSEDKVNRVYERFKDDPLIDEAINGFKKYNDNLVDILRKSGFISESEAEKWKNGFYIPFYRIPTVKIVTDSGIDEESGEVDIPKLSSQIANLSSAKGLTGRNLPVNDAIQNIIANTNYIIGTAAKNIAAQRVARDGVITEYMRRIESPKDAADGTDVITVRFNGEKAYYEVRDRMLYDAVAKSGYPVQDILKAAGWFTEQLRRGTTLFPSFIIKNPIRDLTHTWALGGFGSDFMPPVGEYVKSITSAARKSPTFEVLKSAGIASSGLRKKTIDETATEFRKRLGQEQTNILLKTWDTVVESLEKAADKSESFTRELVYKDVMDRTGDQAEALFAAMETINFSRKGNSRGMQVAMALLPFFNARIQGLDVFYRTLKGDKIMPSQMSVEAKKRAVTRLLYFGALSAIYALLMSDNETYINSTDEEKDNNVFLPLDFIPGIAKGTAFKFPIPPEIGIISKLIPERLAAHYSGNGDISDDWSAAKRAVLDTLAFNPLAQIIRPAYEVYSNFDAYTQKPIENTYLKSLTPEQRYTEYTSGTARAVSDALASLGIGGFSPIQVDHLIRGYFGTSGAFIADVAGRLYEMGEKNPSPERMRFSEPYLMPIIGSLFKSKDGRKAIEDLYSIDEAATMAVATLKLYSEGQKSLSDKQVQELEELSFVKKQVEPIVLKARNLNRMKRAIQADPDLSPKEKRDELNELNQELIEVAKEAQEFKKEVPFRLR